MKCHHPCGDWSLESCTECGESKCLEQSILGKEPWSTYQLWQMQLWWIQIELFRLRGIGLDGKKIIGLCSGVHPSCWGTMTTAKAKQRSPSIIRCNVQLISIFVFLLCICVREKTIEWWRGGRGRFISILAWSMHRSKFVWLSVSSENRRISSKVRKPVAYSTHDCNTHTLQQSDSTIYCTLWTPHFHLLSFNCTKTNTIHQTVT